MNHLSQLIVNCSFSEPSATAVHRLLQRRREIWSCDDWIDSRQLPYDSWYVSPVLSVIKQHIFWSWGICFFIEDHAVSIVGCLHLV